MSNKTLQERVIDLEFELSVTLGFVEGLVKKAKRWDEHVEQKDRVKRALRKVRARKAEILKKKKIKEKAVRIQAECDKENMKIEMAKEKELSLKKLEGAG